MLNSGNEYIIADNIEEFLGIDCGRYNEKILNTKSFLDIINEKNNYISAEDLEEGYFIDFKKTLFFDNYSDDEYNNYLENSGADKLNSFLRDRNVINDFSVMIEDLRSEKELIEFIDTVDNYQISSEESNPYKYHISDLIELVIDKFELDDSENDYLDIEESLSKGIPYTRRGDDISKVKDKSTREKVYLALAKKDICNEEMVKYVDKLSDTEILPKEIVDIVIFKSDNYDIGIVQKVIDNYFKFDTSILNRDFWERVLNEYSPDFLLDNFDKINKTDQEYMVDKVFIKKSNFYIDNDFYEKLKEFKNDFKLDDRKILKNLIKSISGHKSFSEHLDLFNSYPIEILETKWCEDNEHNCIDKIFKNWEKFEGLEEKIADFIFKSRSWILYYSKHG